MDRHVKWRSHCDPAALDRRIKLRCRYECKATDPCLWFSSHRVGHLFAAQQKNRVSGGHAQILTVKFTPFTSRNRRPTLFFNNTASYLIWFVSSCALKCSCWYRFWGRVLAHMAWFAGAHVGFHLGLRSIVNSSKTHTLVRRPLNCPSVPEWEGNRLVTRM